MCGGLPVAGILAVLYLLDGIQPLKFDTALQVPLQNTFFASIGFAASLALLRTRRTAGLPASSSSRSSSPRCRTSSACAVAWALGQHPLMGVLAGSVTLTGGPATGLAFAPLFEEAGVPGAATLAVAAAMVGIVAGGVIGGPIGTYLVERKVRGTGARTAARPARSRTSPKRKSPTPVADGARRRRRRSPTC